MAFYLLLLNSIGGIKETVCIGFMGKINIIPCNAIGVFFAAAVIPGCIGFNPAGMMCQLFPLVLFNSYQIINIHFRHLLRNQ